MRENVTRRRFLIGTGVTVATATGALAVASDNASATVAVDELSVPNADYILTDETITAIDLAVDSTWSWDGNADATGYNLTLSVGSTLENAETIASEEQRDLGTKSLSGDTELTGNILNTSVYSAENFTPSNGEMTTSVIVIVALEVLRDGEVVERAEATDTAELTIRREELSYTVELSATGEWSFTSQ